MARFCKYCGKPRNENARFCRYCGASFNVPAHPQNAQSQQYPGESLYSNRQQDPAYMQQPYGKVKQKDPYKPLRVILAVACIALAAGSMYTIPGKISFVRNGKVSNDESVVIESSGKLTDAQKAEYARINAESDEEGASDDSSLVYIHDNYTWYTGDGSGWLGEDEKEGGQE